MTRVEITRGPEKGMRGTLLDEKPTTNNDDVLVNLDSSYGRVNSRFNRTLSYTYASIRIIEE